MADFGSGGGILGTVTVRTPFSMAAFTSSTLVFSGSLKRRRKLPCARSTRCHLSEEEDVSSFLCSPLICNTRPSSTCTFTSCLLRPEKWYVSQTSDNRCDYRRENRSPRIMAIKKWDSLIESSGRLLLTRQICFEDMSICSFLPIHLRVGYSCGITCEARMVREWGEDEGVGEESIERALWCSSPAIAASKERNRHGQWSRLRFWTEREMDRERRTERSIRGNGSDG